MRRKEQIKRFNLSIVSICLFLIMGLGVAYAVFSYNRLGNNNEFLMGKVYLNYFESANIALTGALPENVSSARNNHGKRLITYNDVPVTLHDNEILFSLDGINESNKDFYFDFYLSEGDSIDGKDRIDPQYVRYDFIRIESNGEENLLVSDKPVLSLDGKCLYSDVLSAYSEIPSTMYKIRIWISKDVTWGDVGLYTYEEFENLYFSAKVSVIGDYSKTIKSLNTGEIEDEIGNLFAPLVYEMEIGGVSAQEYSKYYKQFIGDESNDSSIIRKIGDGVLEIYEKNTNGTYKLKIISDTNVVFPEDCSNLFTNFTNLRRITFNGVDTSNVTDMSGMFKDLEFLYRADLSNFDTSNVTTMKEMFANSGIYDVNLGSIDISSLTDSSYMFYNCTLLSKIYCNPEANINFGNVSTNNDMVTNDTYLSGIIARSGTQVIFYNSANTSGNYLNSDINSQHYFTYNKATSKSYQLSLFYLGSINSYLVTSSNLKNLEFILLDWDTITKLKNNASYYSTITSNIIAFSYGDTTFIASDGVLNTGESAPGFLSPNSYSANPSLSYVNYSYSTYASFVRVSFKNLDTSSTNNFYRFFYRCGSLKYIDFDSLDFSNATNYFQMFQDCAQIEFIDFYYLNAPKVTTFGEMFAGCFHLKKIDLTIFDVSNASGYYGIGGFFAFSGIDAMNPEAIDLNLIDTSKCTSLYGFFMGNIKNYGTKIVLPDNFVHVGITSVDYFFYNCSNLGGWDFDNCDFSGVSSLYYFFYGCTGLTEITKEDLSFLTGRITGFYYTFYGCDNLRSIDLSGITIDNVNSSGSVDFTCSFSSCYYLLEVIFPYSKNSNDSYTFNGTFRYCFDIVHIDLYNLGRGYYNNLNYAFADCQDLETIEFGNTYCYSISNLSYTFYDCYNLEYLDFYKLFSGSGWGSSGSYSLDCTFEYCSKLKVIDLRGFLYHGSGDVQLNSTFVGCNSLETIVAPYYFFAMGHKATENYYPFGSNSKLVGGSGTSYSSGSYSSTMFRPDGYGSSSGYLTIDWSYGMQSNTSTYYKSVNDTMANYLHRFFQANFGTNYSFQNSSATTFVMRYCDSNVYSSLSSSYGATLYNDTNTNTSFYYSYSSGVLSIFTEKPFYFANGKGYVGNTSESILYSMIYNTYGSVSTFRSFSMDCVYCGNLDLQYFLYSLSNLVEFRGLACQTVFSSYSSSLYNTFAYCSNLPKISIMGLKMTNCSNANYAFYYDYYLVDIDMSYVDFGNSGSSSGFFQNIFYNTGTSSSSYLNISFLGANFYSAYGSLFYNMFQGTSKSINTFDTRYITFSYIYSGILSSLPSNVSSHLDFTGWKINYTTSLNSLFASTYLSEYKGLNTWNFGTSLTDVSYMFASSSSASSFDLSGWNVSSVTNFQYMFAGAYNVSSINLDGWDFSSATNFSHMFTGDTLLETIIADFNSDKVTSMDCMFQGCQMIPEIDLSRLDVSKVTDLNNVFSSCFALEVAKVSNWNPSSCTNFASLFYNCNKLTDLGSENNKLNWNTRSATNMSLMFYYCNALSALDLSSFDTTNVVDFTNMFVSDTGIVYMDMSNWVINKSAFNSFNVPILADSINTDLNSILKIKNLDLSGIGEILTNNTLGTILESNFYHYVDASGWKLPPEVRTLHNVFYGMWDLHAIDISNWEGWEYVTTIDGSFISTPGGPFPSRNFTVYAEADFDITGKTFTNETCEHIDLLGGSTETKLLVYIDNDTGQEYGESTESRTNKNKLKVATSISPLDGYFTNVAYRSSHWYSQ